MLIVAAIVGVVALIYSLGFVCPRLFELGSRRHSDGLGFVLAMLGGWLIVGVFIGLFALLLL